MAITRVDKYTEINSQRDVYSDFLTDLDPHPNTQDVVRVTNEGAIKRSIRNILLTNKYERLMQPDFGADITRLLFEPISDINTTLLKEYITEAITSYEQRVKIIDLVIEPIEENQTYRVFLSFFIINRTEPTNMVINLYRVR